MSKSKNFLRDGRAPIPIRVSTSKVMSANKGKDTKPELFLRKELWKSGIRGYRLNWKKAQGRPDIAFPGKKVAIFVNGCFWHRCPYCQLGLPKSNTPFWKEKFEKNIARDKTNIKNLESLGWKVLTIWECQMKNNIGYYIEVIKASVL